MGVARGGAAGSVPSESFCGSSERFILELARKWPTLIRLEDREGDIQTSVMEQSTQLGYRIEATLGDP
jgi:hypothetical protein